MRISVAQLRKLQDFFENWIHEEPVVRNIEEAVWERGYDQCVYDVLSDKTEWLHDSPGSTEDTAFNLIPSRIQGSCRRLLVAFSKGDRGEIGFPSIMRQVREHLIRCIDTTRTVVALCDHWQRDMLDEHIGDLRAHHARGVKFYFLLAPLPGKALQPVMVDLT
jgi:hypothetical protein